MSPRKRSSHSEVSGDGPFPVSPRKRVRHGEGGGGGGGGAVAVEISCVSKKMHVACGLWSRCVSCHGGRGIPFGVRCRQAYDEDLYAEFALLRFTHVRTSFVVYVSIHVCVYVCLCLK